MKEKDIDSTIFLEPEILAYEATIRYIDSLTEKEDKDR